LTFMPGWNGTLVERFEAKYIPEPNCGCWLWIGNACLKPHGEYGQLWIDGRNEMAHRASWLIHRGEIPEGLHVCHRCDVPPCVNPDHLFLGTEADNVADAIAKGRAPQLIRSQFGEANLMAKLTTAEVIAIRADSRTQRLIASDYGVSQTLISHIKTGKAWRAA